MRLLINLPRRVKDRGDYVAVPRQEYKRFAKYQAELRDALKKIGRGVRELRRGRAGEINSVRDLM